VPLNVVSCFGGVAAGWLSSRWGSALVLLVGSVVSLAGFGLILVDLHGPLLYTVTAVGVNFVGGMFVYTAISNVIVDAVPCERTSEATGMNYVIRLIAQAAGAQVVIALLTDHVIATPGHRESSFPTSATYENLFGYLIGVSLLCVVTSAILVRMQCRYRYRRMPFRGI
jgi:MFS family permease